MKIQDHAAPDLHEAIRAALRRRCARALGRVRFEHDGAGYVTLEGEVEDWIERQRVEETVAAVPGVVHVDCRLVVDH